MSALGLHAGRVLFWSLLLFLVPLSPLLGSGSSIVASICALLLVPAIVSPASIPLFLRQPSTVLFAAAFVVLALAFTATARTPHDVIYSLNFVALPLAAIVYLVSLRAPGGAAAVQTFAVLSTAGALACLVIAFNDIVLLELPRLASRTMGPNLLARLGVLFGFLALAGLFTTRSWWRFIFYAAPLAAVLAMLLSSTRGALVMIPFQGIILAAMLYRDRRDRGQVWALVGLAVIAVAVLMLTSDRFASVGQIFGDLVSGAGTDDRSTSDRLARLAAAGQLFLASPLIGYGWANFTAVAYPMLQQWIPSPDDPFFQFHNDLANFAVAAGSVGILCWLALLAAPIIGALATPRDALFRVRLYCCLQLSVWAAVSGLTDFTLGYDLPTTLYVFLTAIVLGAFRPAGSGAPTQRAA